MATKKSKTIGKRKRSVVKDLAPKNARKVKGGLSKIEQAKIDMQKGIIANFRA